MIEYFAADATGAPIYPASQYRSVPLWWKWDTVTEKGEWVTTGGKPHLRSLFKRNHPIVRSWVQVSPEIFEDIYQMDVGL